MRLFRVIAVYPRQPGKHKRLTDAVIVIAEDGDDALVKMVPVFDRRQRGTEFYVIDLEGQYTHDGCGSLNDTGLDVVRDMSCVKLTVA